jgi:CheY-like chemotaxis protein
VEEDDDEVAAPPSQPIPEVLVRADRLAALGRLTGVVTHELNNPLTYVQLSLRSLERELNGLAIPEAQREALLGHLHNVRHGAERVAEVVERLSDFDRAADRAPGPVDLVVAIERALALAHNDLHHRARLARRYREVPPVIGNGPRLEQAFLNVLLNAAESLPAGDPARDEIGIEIAPGRPGEVEIAITDTGCGVPEALVERVFEPFFTTRRSGESAGLGLSVCRSIVEEYGGRVALHSVEGAGTAVQVVLRAADAAPVAAEEMVTARLLVPEGRRLRVLVVDDEPLVRAVLQDVLAMQHEVVVADDGWAALRAIERAEPIDAVLCDVMMPAMNGMELYAAVRDRRPGLERRIVFLTGGAFVPRLAAFLDTVDNPALQKPIDVLEVLAAVQAAAEK